MRGSRHQYKMHQGVFPVGGTVNVTNITNITNLTNVSVVGVSGRRGSAHIPRSAVRHDHKPRLNRFYSTLGLADRDVASRMSDGELCYETAKVVGYNARGFANDIGTAAKCLFSAIGALFR